MACLSRNIGLPGEHLMGHIPSSIRSARLRVEISHAYSAQFRTNPNQTLVYAGGLFPIFLEVANPLSSFIQHNFSHNNQNQTTTLSAQLSSISLPISTLHLLFISPKGVPVPKLTARCFLRLAQNKGAC